MAISVCAGEVHPSLREKIAHGTVAFPFACYADNLDVMDVPWHWHDELEAAVVTAGDFLLQTDCEKSLLHAGDAFFVNAGVLHAGVAQGAGCRLHSVVFHPRLLASGVDSVFWQKYLQPLVADPAFKGAALRRVTPWQQQAADAVERAWQAAAAEGPAYEFAVRSALSDFMALILTKAHTPAAQRPDAKAARDNERIKTMLQFVADHLAEPLTTAEIAASAAVSASECLRCFRATIGTSPIRYAKTLRLQRAAELLSGSDLKVNEVGEQCGFQDMSYFARSFLQERGCTPTDYRKKHQNAGHLS